MRAQARSRSASRATTRSAICCGSVAKPRFPRWVGSRRTTTAWTARFRAHGSPKCCAPLTELSSEFGLPVANVFHAGDGNLHPLILYDANVPDQLARAERMGERILALCVRVGGTVTGEHGVGVEKLDAMCGQFAADELAQFHRLKAAFDPAGLLNPGKAVPTLVRCAELGGMHVARNAPAFPELERF